MKKIVFTVTNDLVYDQRMDRICSTLAEYGYDCLLIGRKLNYSPPLSRRNYKCRRIPCYFTKGKLFYLEYNVKLLLVLLFQKCDAICAIDLDTALPAYLASLARNKKFFFDAHEYFTEMEEVVSRPFIKWCWKKLEAFILPRIDGGYTISEGYRELYNNQYEIELDVVRNVSRLDENFVPAENEKPEKVIIYQGILNVGRGLEEMIAAMQLLPEFQLHIYGDGPIKAHLEKEILEKQVSNRVFLKGFCNPEELKLRTRGAWLGLTLFSDVGLHHKHSLANRFFDYIHAGVPQLACAFPEYIKFNQSHEVAVLMNSLKSDVIAEKIRSLDERKDLYYILKRNCLLARQEHNWQRESEKLTGFYQSNLP